MPTCFTHDLTTETFLRLIEVDPHQFSTRPCGTCASITALVDRDFGCVTYAKAHKRG